MADQKQKPDDDRPRKQEQTAAYRLKPGTKLHVRDEEADQMRLVPPESVVQLTANQAEAWKDLVEKV